MDDEEARERFRATYKKESILLTDLRIPVDRENHNGDEESAGIPLRALNKLEAAGILWAHQLAACCPFRLADCAHKCRCFPKGKPEGFPFAYLADVETNAQKTVVTLYAVLRHWIKIKPMQYRHALHLCRQLMADIDSLPPEAFVEAPDFFPNIRVRCENLSETIRQTKRVSVRQEAVIHTWQEYVSVWLPDPE